MIKRPYKTRNTVQNMNLQNIQENFEEQFENIYNYLDSNENIYSADEPIKIGTWKDGRDLYRKVYEIKSISADTIAHKFSIADLNFNEIIKIEGSFKYSNGKLPFNFYNKNANKGTYLYFLGTDIIYNSEFNGTNADIVVIYTI